MLDQKEFTVSTSAVLQLVSRSNCSAYDCGFVELAHANGVRLFTVDRQILNEFLEVAISLKRFVRRLRFGREPLTLVLAIVT